MPEESNEEEKTIKSKFSTGISSISDKAKDTAKKGLETVEAKTKEMATKGVQKIEEKAHEVIANSINLEENQSRSNRNTNRNTSNISRMGTELSNTGKNMERQVATWIGWFWSTIAYLFVIIISFAISSNDSRFGLLPIVLIIGFPFFLYYAIVNSIPEIKIGNRVYFSRKNLSFKRQLSFTSQVARAFSREMIKNSPVGAFFIFAFLLILLYVIINPFIN